MLATKRDMAPPQSPGKIESTRQRLATLFSGFSPFGSPLKPTAGKGRGDNLESNVNSDSVSSMETDELAEKMASWSLDRAGFLDLPDELYVQPGTV